MIEVQTTIGTALIRIRAISSVVSNPSHPDTCLLHTLDGQSFEVSGTLKEINIKING